MENSVVLSNWCIDAFDCLSSKLFTKLSFEQISRVDTFISAVVLFEEVYLSENYVKNRLVMELNKRDPGSIKIVKKDDMCHSTDMTEHISIDVDLHSLAFDELAKENRIWQIQHDPSVGIDVIKRADSDPECKAMLDSKFLTELRLWHWCYTNEMAELTNSVNMLPLSLNAVSDYANKKPNLTDVTLKRYLDYAAYHNQRFIRMSETLSTPFISEIKSIPPLMSVLLSRCKKSDDMVTILADMRSEFAEFRQLRHKFTNTVLAAKNIGEQEAAVEDWNRAWGVLSSGEFKKPNLLKRKITSTDISTSVTSIGSGGVKTIVKNLIDHHQYKKCYKQFQVFSTVDEYINNIDQRKLLLGEVFGVESIVSMTFKV